MKQPLLVLTIRTDKPEAEIGLYKDTQQLVYKTWEAHRKLAESIHKTVQELLNDQNLDWVDIEAVVVYQGPGSFTGLRIGISVANALAYSLNIPIVATTGDWIQEGIERILADQPDRLAIAEYGSPVHITKPRTQL